MEEVREAVLEGNEKKLKNVSLKDVKAPAKEMHPSSTAVNSKEEKGINRMSSVDGFCLSNTTDRAASGFNHEIGIEMSSLPSGACDPHKNRLSKMGLMTALAIGIHNFPEGLATFMGTLDDPQ